MAIEDLIRIETEAESPFAGELEVELEELKEVAVHAYRTSLCLRDYFCSIDSLGLLDSVDSPTFWNLWRDIRFLLTTLETLLGRHCKDAVDVSDGAELVNWLVKSRERFVWKDLLRESGIDSPVDEAGQTDQAEADPNDLLG